MTGFDAIAHNHGWSMALAGAIIVFMGLVVLALAISQLQRFFRSGEQKASETDEKNNKESTSLLSISIPDPFPLDTKDAATVYQPIIESLGELFKLSDLYAACHKAGIPHPHLTISRFRQDGFLVLKQDQLFAWNRP